MTKFLRKQKKLSQEEGSETETKPKDNKSSSTETVDSKNKFTKENILKLYEDSKEAAKRVKAHELRLADTPLKKQAVEKFWTEWEKKAETELQNDWLSRVDEYASLASQKNLI